MDDQFSMTPAVAITQSATPLDFGDLTTKLTSRIDINRDKTRYVACLGNHLENGDSRQLNSIGGWAGGIWVGHSEVEGAPTMKRTHHMILRGLFTPLETRAVMRKADHRETEGYRESYLDGPGVPPGTRGYTVYAGDDLAFVQNDWYKPMGVVEITPLMGVEWDSEVRKSLQNFFFADWQNWQRGEGAIPILLDDWVSLVKEAQNKAQYQSHNIIAEELLESARIFRVYAMNQIEKNRQAIQSMRAADHQGLYIGWHNKCRMFAEQLGITLEDEKSLAPSNSGNTDLIAKEMREDRKLREKELEAQKEYNRILMAKLLGEEMPPPAPVVEEVVSITQDELDSQMRIMAENSVSFGDAPMPEVAEEVISDSGELVLAPTEAPSELTYGCPKFNAQGEPCKARVKEGQEMCSFHTKQDEADKGELIG